MRKLFTLIELTVVIVIISILAAIVLPNISNWQQEADHTALLSNARNLQTGVDTYRVKNNGELPTLDKPTSLIPQPLDFTKIHPKYTRNMPKSKMAKYWVDYQGKVWVSTADAPSNVINENGTVTWNVVKNADFYAVYEAKTKSTSAVDNNKGISFVENTKENTFKGEPEKEYLVSSFDSYNLESAPSGAGYTPYVNPTYNSVIGEIGGEDGYQPVDPPSPEKGITEVEKFNWPLNMTSVTWKNSDSNLRDGNTATYFSIGGNAEYTLEWEGDMANRVIELLFTTSYAGSGKSFQFLDLEGKAVSFIDADTDAKYNPYNAGYDWRNKTVRFVVPRGAVKLKIYGSSSLTLYEANFVKDLSLPNPVTKVSSEATKDSITLNWTNPSGANFKKVAVYRDDKFVGYSDNGSFTDTPLYSDTEYKYFLEPVSVVGNRGQRVYHTKKTVRPEIVWRGLNNPSAFDESFTTGVAVANGQEITWEGDLTNRMITLTLTNTYAGSGNTFAFYNENNQALMTKRGTDDYNSKSFGVSYDQRNYKLSLIVPEGATKLRIDGSSTVTLWDIRHGESLALPSKLTIVTSSSDKNSVTFNFDKNEDVVKVAIYRDGKFIGYSTTNTYTDNPLYSSTEYQYVLETINASGNRTQSHSVSEKTKTPEIIWRGLNNPSAFDESFTTGVAVANGQEITWEGDLSNRMITLTFTNTYAGSGNNFAFYNTNNQQLNAVRANDDYNTKLFGVSYDQRNYKLSLVVPEGATKLRIDGSSTLTLWDIRHGDLNLPTSVSGVSSTSNGYSITLNYSKPSNASKVAVYRDGKFIGYSTTSSYVDNSLYSDTTYSYTIYSINEAGNRSNGVSYSAKTTRPEIVWRGLSNAKAFDNSYSTGVAVTNGEMITWEGDLTNRKVTVTFTNTYAGSGNTFEILDTSNQRLQFTVNTNTNLYSIYNVSYDQRNAKVTFNMPTGAAKIRINGSSTLTLWDIREEQ